MEAISCFNNKHEFGEFKPIDLENIENSYLENKGAE